MTTCASEQATIDQALAIAADPTVAAAHALYAEALATHRAEPWRVNSATVEVLRQRWTDAVRAAS